MAVWDVRVFLFGLQLSNVWGQLVSFPSPDEVCESISPPGWEFRPFPFWGECSIYSCINKNPGGRFGEMTLQMNYIDGKYCGEGMVCMWNQCTTYNETIQPYPYIVVQGGWSAWGPYSPCSRSCGTGLTLAHRTCTNPKPEFAPSCDGLDYKGHICYTQPCPDEQYIEEAIIDQRTSETCKALLYSGVLDPNLYGPTGEVYSVFNFGVCEVICDVIGKVDYNPYIRHGLMPDGTPCPGNLTIKDRDDWPRRSGNSSRCVQGYCWYLGCDGWLDGKVFDGCGVCGGDNSTCIVDEGGFTRNMDKGERIVLVTLPTDSYNIEITADPAMDTEIFIELWSKDDRAIIASRVWYSYVYTTGTNPFHFAGTYWHYTSNAQFLYAKGPLDQPVVIKLHQQNIGNNTGVNYAYSMPPEVENCTGTCATGTWWQCGCLCPAGWYGKNCDTQCSTFCNNGQTLDEATCSCQCTSNRTYGDKCSCKYPYRGEDCTQCKIWKCENLGVFDQSTCRCTCPGGTGGLACEMPCKDTLGDCGVRATFGECYSNNEVTEPKCALSCGLCSAAHGFRNCHAFGDVHVSGFVLGQPFNTGDLCEYTLSNVAPVSDPRCAMSIVMQGKRRPLSAYPYNIWIDYVAMRFALDDTEFKMKDYDLLLDGTVLLLNQTITRANITVDAVRRDDQSIFLTTDCDINLLFDWNAVVVYAQSYFFERHYTGLCGGMSQSAKPRFLANANDPEFVRNMRTCRMP